MSGRGPRHATLGLARAIAAFVVAGCGAPGPATGGPSVSPLASASPASPSAGGSAGTATPRPAGAYSLTLPKGWRAVQIGSNYAATATAFNTVNLRFATSLMSQLSGLPKTATAYAFDASDPTVQSGALVALTVTEVVLPVTVDLDTFSAQVGRQVSLVAETPVPAARIQTASGPADRYIYVATFGQTAAGTEVASITQYVMVKPGRGYVLTFSTTPARAGGDAPTFESIAESIALMP